MLGAEARRSAGRSRSSPTTAPARPATSAPSSSRRAPPDGYTLLFAADLVRHQSRAEPEAAVRPGEELRAGRRWSPPARSRCSSTPQVPARSRCANSSSSRSAQPGKLNYSSPGNGGPQHLAMELLKLETGIDVVHVPYKGLGRRDRRPDRRPRAGDGRRRCRPSRPTCRRAGCACSAVMSAERAPAFPDVPTMKELGLPNLEVETWYALFAPAGTPAASRRASSTRELNVAPAMSRTMRESAGEAGPGAAAADRRSASGELVKTRAGALVARGQRAGIKGRTDGMSLIAGPGGGIPHPRRARRHRRLRARQRALAAQSEALLPGALDRARAGAAERTSSNTTSTATRSTPRRRASRCASASSTARSTRRGPT